MKIKNNESLSRYTTFKMGGTAKIMFFPENINDLREIYEKSPSAFDYIIGGGSNIVINDKRDFEAVVCLRNLNSDIEHLGEGQYYVGAGVRLQSLIRTINKDGYGGIEYLFSVPGFVGGATFMNAGRGKTIKKCISDYILRVDGFINGENVTFTKEECDFSYRTSVFQTLKGCVITGVLFEFPAMSQEESSAQIRERIELCKGVQDMSFPNYGSVFCQFDRRIIRFVRRIGLGKKGGCHFSKKTENWMLHEKNGNFKDVVRILKQVEWMHKICGKSCKTEVRIWK